MPLLDPPVTWTIDPPHGHGSRTFKFSASQPELDALKVYIGVDRIVNLAAQTEIAPLSKGRFRAAGYFTATFVQLSVVSLEEIETAVREEFSVEYWPQDQIEAANLSIDNSDVEALTEDKIAFGALVSELLSVLIDPYPRLPGEQFEEIVEDAGVDEKPFAKLAKLAIIKSDKG